MAEYGGIIGTMYSQYREEEIPENIRKYKERIDSLFLVNSFFELYKELETFNEKEINYLNCIYLDELRKIHRCENPMEQAMCKNLSDKIIELIFEIKKREKINELNNNIIKDREIYNAFTIACEKGKLSVVKKLFPSVDIHVDRDYALRRAADEGHIEVVNFLIENGADVHTRDHYALRYAAENGHLAVVRRLLEAGVEANAEHGTALVWAAGKGHFDVVNLLLENGADAHARNDEALNLALLGGYTNVVNRLRGYK